jgi:hypothetical protein
VTPSSTPTTGCSGRAAAPAERRTRAPSLSAGRRRALSARRWAHRTAVAGPLPGLPAGIVLRTAAAPRRRPRPPCERVALPSRASDMRDTSGAGAIPVARSRAPAALVSRTAAADGSRDPPRATSATGAPAIRPDRTSGPPAGLGSRENPKADRRTPRTVDTRKRERVGLALSHRECQLGPFETGRGPVQRGGRPATTGPRLVEGTSSPRRGCDRRRRIRSLAQSARR